MLYHYTVVAKNGATLIRRSLSDYFSMTSWYWNAGKGVQREQKDCSIYIHSIA